MKLKILRKATYTVSAVVESEECPVETFIVRGESATKAHRIGLTILIDRVSKEGLRCLPSALTHCVDEEEGIYEFIKGPLRLFYFRGLLQEVVVCTVGGRKTGQKVDKKAVRKSIQLKKQYFEQYAEHTYLE